MTDPLDLTVAVFIQSSPSRHIVDCIRAVPDLLVDARNTLRMLDGRSECDAARAGPRRERGRYSPRPGEYTVQASAPQLVLPQRVKIVLDQGARTLNVQLRVSTVAEKVTVEENAGPNVSTEASNNASQLVLRGQDLDSLHDDPNDLMTGPAGPRRTKRRFRFYLPEYDKLGYGPYRDLHQTRCGQISGDR